MSSVPTCLNAWTYLRTWDRLTNDLGSLNVATEVDAIAPPVPVIAGRRNRVTMLRPRTDRVRITRYAFNLPKENLARGFIFKRRFVANEKTLTISVDRTL